MKNNLICFLFLLFFSVVGQAQDSENAVSKGLSVSEQIQEKAKRRMYPGGQDESDIKVQAQLVKPGRKLAPAAEEPTEPANND